MMGLLMFLLFMIPLVVCNFWFNQILWLILSFIFLLMYVSDSMVSYLSFEYGMDLMSFVLIFLSLWVCSLMIMASEKINYYGNWPGLFSFILLFLILALYLTFSSLNMFVFYLFFEVSLIPTLILILGWGYQPERLQAGIYLLFYTLLASLPMMISLFYCYSKFGSLMFYFFGMVDNFMIYLLVNSVFLVKFPMFMVHLWLPKAHVEAPVSGSMILAGIMLKLGGYGMLRFMSMFLLISSKINFFFVSISLVGGFLISLVCLRQSDMKSLIAYSSVSHMALVLSGIMTLGYWGMSGSVAMMVAHGLCSSGLFCLANVSYERLLSRSLYLNKGLINIMPSLSLVWFLLVSSNMAAPPSLNLIGEIFLINSLISFSQTSMLFISLISFFGAAYSLYLFSFSQHGSFYSGVFSFSPCLMREYIVLILHWVPLNLIFLVGDYFTLWI